MSPVFTINFRREAFQKEQANARRRVLRLGLWSAYFGSILVIVGLYGLNCVSLTTRTRAIERQAARMRSAQSAGLEWRPKADDAVAIARVLADSRQWRDRLARLPEVLPEHARITSMQFNPDNLSGGAQKLVLTGEFRGASGPDRVRQVMTFAEALKKDSLFSAGYSDIRLVTTRTSGTGDDAVEFVVECR